jgi:uncharacterized protein YjiS (DUF1127 family)
MKTDDVAASAPQTILREMGSCKATAQGFSRSVTNRLRSIIRIWAQRHRNRQDLLDLLDRRTAGDMGSSEHELKAWAQKPFWLP